MKRNARERERELRFASVLDSDTGGLLRLMRPVFRRIVRRAVSTIFPSLGHTGIFFLLFLASRSRTRW